MTQTVKIVINYRSFCKDVVIRTALNAAPMQQNREEGVIVAEAEEEEGVVGNNNFVEALN